MTPKFSSTYTPQQTEQPKMPKIKRANSRFGGFLKRHWVSIIIVLASLAATGTLVFLLRSIVFSSPDVVKIPKKPPVYYAKLSGLKVASENDITRAITAIMIENSPNARPQSGLKQAEVVFEAIAEGGITRFLTLFQANQPNLVGPVRSIRMYYVDWLTPFQASIAHVGGSQEALNEVRSGRYRDIDQMFNSPYYWRASDRYAPHNVYTNFEKLNSLNQQKSYTKSDPDVIIRQDPKPVTEPTATSINVTLSSDLFNSHYTYDANTNKYTRYQAGAPHLDREEGAITPDAIIAIKVNMHLSADGVHNDITTIGSGQAHIFQNGTVLDATWKKPSRGEQLKFYNAEGKEIAINRGQLWIVAVPSANGKVTWQ